MKAPVDGPREVENHFMPIPWDIRSDEDMRDVLNFAHRVRLTPFAKDLLALPCMLEDIAVAAAQPGQDRSSGGNWDSGYRELHDSSIADFVHLSDLQKERLKVSRKEEDSEWSRMNTIVVGVVSNVTLLLHLRQ